MWTTPVQPRLARALSRRAVRPHTRLWRSPLRMTTPHVFNAGLRTESGAKLPPNDSKTPPIAVDPFTETLEVNPLRRDLQVQLEKAVKTLRRTDLVRVDRDVLVQAIASVRVPSDASIVAREQVADDIVAAKVLPLLVHVLQEPSLEDVHVPTYLTLIRLSAEATIADELLQLRAADLVASYLTHPNPRLQAAASLLLGNLALQPTADTAMASMTVVDPLFHALQSPHEPLQRTAATTLGSIAGQDKGRAVLAQQTNVTTLCKLLTPDHSDDLRSVVAYTLGNVLAGHNPSAQRIVGESGALANLVLITSHAFSDEASSAAAWALHHSVYEYPENQTTVGAAGGVGLLFQHAFAENEELQTNALLALESLTRNHDDNLERCRAITNVVERLYALRHEGDDLNLHAQRALDALLQLIH